MINPRHHHMSSFSFLSSSLASPHRTLAANDFRCYKDEDNDIFYPVCNGRAWNEYCDGEEGDCRNSNFCSCESAQDFCNTKSNPCENDPYPTCHGYITGYDTWMLESVKPQPLDCDSSYGAPVHYVDASCCSNEGLYFVTSSQIGGFEFQYATNDFTAGSCGAHAYAMSSILCDPNQGRYIKNNTITVCLSSCQQLFNACGLPGDNFVDWANYTDAESLCKAAWGGFFFSDGDKRPCQLRPYGYPCGAQVYNVEVVSGDDCLAMITPSQELIKYHSDPFAERPSECFAAGRGGWIMPVIIASGVVGGIICLSIAVLFIWYCCNRNTSDHPGSTNVAIAEKPVLNAASYAMTPAYIGEPEVPVVAQPVIKPIPVPIPTAPTLEQLTVKKAATEPKKGTSLFDQLQGGAAANASSTEVELTFEQKLSLRELEGRKLMGAISDQEFERLRNKILLG